MKSKELKILRKRLTSANRCEDLLKGIDNATSYSVRTNDSTNEKSVPSEDEDCRRKENLFITFLPSSQIDDNRQTEFLTLFEKNMGEMYRNSSWGLDMDGKSAELRNDKARFLFVTDDEESLVGFLHFRFEYDDEESPTCAVLYVYEIQIESAYRRCGVGRHLMSIAERIAREQTMSKVVLTVFKKNTQAMTFYTTSLGYNIDEASPSQFEDHSADYEILSLKLQ